MATLQQKEVKKKRGTVRITHVLYSALNSKYAQKVLQIHMQP